MIKKEFIVNEYITQKLEKDSTVIYIKGERFNHCKFILFNKSTSKNGIIKENSSIDVTIDDMEEKLEKLT